MVWLLNGTVALTISSVHGVLSSPNRNVTAEKHRTSKGDSWVFVLKNVERLHQGQVTCDIEGIDQKTASLFVQGMYAHMDACSSFWTLRSTEAAESVSVPTSGILTFLQIEVCPHTRTHTHGS